MSNLRTILNDMEDDVLSTVDLLNVISVIAWANTQPLHRLGAEEAEGLIRVVDAALQHANKIKECWNDMFEVTKPAPT